MAMTPTCAPRVEEQPLRPLAFRQYHGGMTEERTLFTTAEAAAMLGLSHVAVKTAAYNGTLAVVRVNPRLNMVTREAIEAYRRDHLGRVGRPRKRKKAGQMVTKARKATTHDTVEEGQSEPPRE